MRSAMYWRGDRTPKTVIMFLRIDAKSEPRWGVARKNMHRIRSLNSGTSLERMKAYFTPINRGYWSYEFAKRNPYLFNHKTSHGMTN